MIGWVCANDDHLALDSRRPDVLRVLKELDLVYGPAIGIRHDDGFELGKVGGRVGPPLGIRSNMGCRLVRQSIIQGSYTHTGESQHLGSLIILLVEHVLVEQKILRTSEPG